MKKHYILFSISLLFISCNSNSQITETTPTSSNFNNYWYQGKAEISSYDLKQARYGEIRTGSAVMIFVTEDFSKSKQVKLDNPEANKKDAIKVLKLNATRKFNTGVYPYSMMTSIFTPVNGSSSLKLTTSSQEWCGHSFSQLNNLESNYRYQHHSYFESEGEIDKKIPVYFLEDELWNIIRINPNSLPIGNIELYPSSLYQRFKHIPFLKYSAVAKKIEKGSSIFYKLTYSNLDRDIEIEYQKEFPYKILGWQETYVSGWGEGAKKLTSTASLKKTLLLDYWNKNDNKDSQFRKELELY